jgi:hypothetical protein
MDMRRDVRNRIFSLLALLGFAILCNRAPAFPRSPEINPKQLISATPAHREAGGGSIQIKVNAGPEFKEMP